MIFTLYGYVYMKETGIINNFDTAWPTWNLIILIILFIMRGNKKESEEIEESEPEIDIDNNLINPDSNIDNNIGVNNKLNKSQVSEDYLQILYNQINMF